MADYSRALAACSPTPSLRSDRRFEAFCFGTRLTRVTRALATAELDEALDRAAAEVVDWNGGTRIGDSLKRLLDEYGHRGLARGAEVVICSDGLDVGDPDLLAAQMARLSRLAHRVDLAQPAAGGSRLRAAGARACTRRFPTWTSSRAATTSRASRRSPRCSPSAERNPGAVSRRTRADGRYDRSSGQRAPLRTAEAPPRARRRPRRRRDGRRRGAVAAAGERAHVGRQVVAAGPARRGRPARGRPSPPRRGHSGAVRARPGRQDNRARLGPADRRRPKRRRRRRRAGRADFRLPLLPRLPQDRRLPPPARHDPRHPIGHRAPGGAVAQRARRLALAAQGRSRPLPARRNRPRRAGARRANPGRLPARPGRRPAGRTLRQLVRRARPQRPQRGDRARRRRTALRRSRRAAGRGQPRPQRRRAQHAARPTRHAHPREPTTRLAEPARLRARRRQRLARRPSRRRRLRALLAPSARSLAARHAHRRLAAPARDAGTPRAQGHPSSSGRKTGA